MSVSSFGPRAPIASPCLLFAALLSSGAIAQSLNPVVVTGTREAQPLSQSTADLVLIDATTIRNSSADSVEDLLRREAGLQITRTGGPGQSSGYFIRGVSTSGTTVLVDGVRVGSATLGQAEFEAISLSQIDHIEVLRGPASSLYGADGVGGVIQIFMRRGTASPQISGGIAIGGYRSKKADIGISGAQGGFDYAATIGRDSSRGTSAIRPGDQFGSYNPDDDGFQRNYGNLRLGYTPAAGHRIGVSVLASRLGVQYDSADYDANFNPVATADFRNRLSTKVGSIDYRGEISTLWTTTVQASQSTDDSTSGGATPSRFRTEREQATWQNALHFGADQQLVLAYEHLNEKVNGDGFGPERSRGNNALTAGYAGRFGASGIEASLRHDSNSAYGNNTTGNLGWNFEVVRGLTLRALAGTSFRAPTFNDLYYPFYGRNADNSPDGVGTRPEKGRNIEVGASWQSGTTAASATVYRNRVRDLIGYDPDTTGKTCPAGFFGCANNVSRAVLTGATLTAADRFAGIDLRATVDFLDAKDADTGVRLARRAAHQESVSADYDAGRWSVGASLLDVGSRPDGNVTLGGYATVDLRAAWRVMPKWRLEAKLLNALDHRVEPVRDYQGLGRQAWIGVRFDGVGL